MFVVSPSTESTPATRPRPRPSARDHPLAPLRCSMRRPSLVLRSHAPHVALIWHYPLSRLAPIAFGFAGRGIMSIPRISMRRSRQASVARRGRCQSERSDSSFTSQSNHHEKGGTPTMCLQGCCRCERPRFRDRMLPLSGIVEKGKPRPRWRMSSAFVLKLPPALLLAQLPR
jgi:hypothetical protein